MVSFIEAAGVLAIRYFQLRTKLRKFRSKVSDDHLKYVILLALTKVQPTTKQTASLRINGLFEGNLSGQRKYTCLCDNFLFHML